MGRRTLRLQHAVATATQRMRPPVASAGFALESLENRLVFAAPAIGVSLDQVVDYSTSWPFTDVFQTSRPWISNSYNTVTGAENFNDSTPVATDAAGWPTQLASWTNAQGQLVKQRATTLMFREIGNVYPAGVYHAQWEGSGSVSFLGASQVVSQSTSADGVTRADLKVTPNDTGIWLRINDMDAANPIRNIHVWMPDYDTNGDGVADESFKGQIWNPKSNFSPFHPDFVNRVKPFKVIRFMDWEDSNQSTLVSWDQRSHYDDARQTVAGKGVAFEYMIALCNETGADMWLNLPFQANADFIRNLAQLVVTQLKPGRQVYLEYGNEVWNYAGGFKAFYWISDQLAKPENASYNGDRWKFEADQIKRDFDIFTDVFTSANQQDRLTRVVAGQASNPWVTEQILLNMEGKFDAISCAGYFGLSDAQRASYTAATTADQIVNDILNNAPGSMAGLRSHKVFVDQYTQSLGRKIKLVAYESGQHADGQGKNLPWLNALFAAQTNPLMYEAYDDYLRAAYELGVDELTHFTFTSAQSKYGSWGALTYQNEPIEKAPKYRALLDAATGYMWRPEYAVETVDRFINEFGQSAGSFRIFRTGDVSVEQDVHFSFTGGTAGPDDILPVDTVVHFAAGEKSKLVTVQAQDDEALEDQETLTLALTPGDGYKVDYKKGSSSMVVNDDDGSVVYGLPIVNPGFDIGDFTGWSLDPIKNNKATVVAKVSAGAPSNPKNGTSFVWGAGAANNVGSGANPAGASQRIDLSAHAQRIDWGFATLNVGGWGAGEGVGLDYASIELSFFDAPTGGQQIGQTFVSNKAEAAKTWTKMNVAANVPVGARSVQVKLLTTRSASTAISNAGFDDISGQLTYSLFPTVQVQAGPATPESGGTYFTFTRAGPDPVGDLTVNYTVAGTATAGADYEALPGSVVIPNGQSSVTVRVAPINDRAVEPDETVAVTIVGRANYSVGPASTASVTLTDDDLPIVTVEAVKPDASESGESAIFAFTRATDNLDEPLVVRYAVSGTATPADYENLSGTVTIPAGERTGVVVLKPIDDKVRERSETVTLTVSPDAAYGVGATNAATATIADDDLPTVTIEATTPRAAEQGTVAGVFTITRVGDLIDEPLVVKLHSNGTAAAGADYAALPDSVTIPAGQTSVTLNVAPLDDSLPEGTEAVVLTIEPDAAYTFGAQTSASVRIEDNDAPPTVDQVLVSGSGWSQSFVTALRGAGLGDDAGYSVPSGATPATLPWSNIDRVSVRFSNDVQVSSGSLSLFGVNVPSYAFKAFTYDDQTYTATWTLNRLVSNDKLLIKLSSTGANAVKDRAGLPLDGDFAAGRTALPSGNGTAGGDFQFRFNVLPGDVNGSSIVDAVDLIQIRNRVGTTGSSVAYSVFNDIDANGVISATDMAFVRGRTAVRLPSTDPAVRQTLRRQ